MNTPEGRIKGVETMRKKYGDKIYAKIGAKGGANSPNRPMRDPEYARKLAHIRWAKYRKEQEQSKVTQGEI
jgi:hypothetical protein